MPIIKDPVSRVWRIICHFARSVYDSKGCSGKWAMCLCLGGWLRTKLNILQKRKIILLTFRETQFFVDISRHEICPYWEMWYEKNYEAFSQFKASEESRIVDVGGHIGFYTVGGGCVFWRIWPLILVQSGHLSERSDAGLSLYVRVARLSQGFSFSH